MQTEIKPQPGPQEKFLSSTADIAIFGGAAGGGKSHALLMEPLRHKDTRLFKGVIFRRTIKQVKNPGSIFEASQEIYPLVGARQTSSPPMWQFPAGGKLVFSHLEHEKNKYDWQGAEIPFIGFDELTHFTETQFWYLLSRNRSMSGIPGYIRATCNADAESWVRELIDWWIDPETGFPIEERSGVIRWFIRLNGHLHFADHPAELIEEFGDEVKPKSLTFIGAKIHDNPILMEKDPSYLANLHALDPVEKARLLDGNWDIKPAAGLYFAEGDFEIVDAHPILVKTVRYWDLAGTKPKAGVVKTNPDWTVGLKLGKCINNQFYVVDVERCREDPLGVETRVKNKASQDGVGVHIAIEQEPGSSGKTVGHYYIRQLAGYSVAAIPSQTDKVTRAGPASSQAKAGNIKLLRGPWNKAFLTELNNFPSVKSKDDQVDGLSGAFNFLTEGNVGRFTRDLNKRRDVGKKVQNIRKRPKRSINSSSW